MTMPVSACPIYKDGVKHRPVMRSLALRSSSPHHTPSSSSARPSFPIPAARNPPPPNDPDRPKYRATQVEEKKEQKRLGIGNSFLSTPSRPHATRLLPPQRALPSPSLPRSPPPNGPARQKFRATQVEEKQKKEKEKEKNRNALESTIFSLTIGNALLRRNPVHVAPNVPSRSMSRSTVQIA